MALSIPCSIGHHDGCLQYTHNPNDEALQANTAHTPKLDPAETVPCDCACHVGFKRTIEVKGRLFDIVVPDDPHYTEPSMPEYRAMETAVREALRLKLEMEESGAATDHSLPTDGSAVPVEQLDLWTGKPSEPPPPPTTVESYQEQALATRGHFDSVNELMTFSALGLAAEAGEAANIVCKIVFHGHPYTSEQRAKVVEECGDVLWFLASLLDSVDCTLLEAMQANNAKLRARYGGKFSTAKSIARVDVAASASGK